MDVALLQGARSTEFASQTLNNTQGSNGERIHGSRDWRDVTSTHVGKWQRFENDLKPLEEILNWPLSQAPK